MKHSRLAIPNGPNSCVKRRPLGFDTSRRPMLRPSEDFDHPATFFAPTHASLPQDSVDWYGSTLLRATKLQSLTWKRPAMPGAAISAPNRTIRSWQCAGMVWRAKTETDHVRATGSSLGSGTDLLQNRRIPANVGVIANRHGGANRLDRAICRSVGRGMNQGERSIFGGPVSDAKNR